MKEDCNLDTLRTIEVRNIKQKLTPNHDKRESQDVFDSTNQNRKLSQHHYQRVVWLLDLMPRWIMGGIAFTCKYWRPLAAPRAILTISEAMRELDVAVLLWQRSFLYVSINKFWVCQWTDQSHRNSFPTSLIWFQWMVISKLFTQRLPSLNSSKHRKI